MKRGSFSLVIVMLRLNVDVQKFVVSCNNGILFHLISCLLIEKCHHDMEFWLPVCRCNPRFYKLILRLTLHVFHPRNKNVHERYLACISHFQRKV